ncbi:hexokinase 1a, partial [Tanacetum coccineum]
MGKGTVLVAVIGGAMVIAGGAMIIRHRISNTSRCVKSCDILKDLEENCGTDIGKLKQIGDAMCVEMHADLEENCGTDIGKLKQIGDAMCVEMHAGLASEGGSKLKMLISYVDNLPTGIAYEKRLDLFFVLCGVFDEIMVRHRISESKTRPPWLR